MEEGGTKKAACEALGIRYNTKRLETLIDAYSQRKQAAKKLRARKRKEALAGAELAQMISMYLQGYSLKEVADSYYRSTGNIKYYLEKHSANLRANVTDQLNPQLLPDACMCDSHEINDYVWSAKYNCVAQVIGEYKGAYRIQVLSDGIQQQAYQECADLGSIKHLEALGIDFSKFESYMSGEDMKIILSETLRKARKNANVTR